MGGTHEQWTNALTHQQDPNAMDLSQTWAWSTMTKDEKTRWIKEGKCFQCDQKGHIFWYCPQKNNRIAEALTSSTPSSSVVIATATIASNKALTVDQKAEIFLTQLYNESNDVHACFTNIMFDKKEDFPHA